MALMMSGNQTAMAFAQRVAPLVARDNPNWTSVTADGQVMMVNPQNPAQRVVIGRANDQPLERIRQPDGSERLVPRAEAAGQTSAAPTRERDAFGQANTLRDEFTKLTGEFRVVRDAFSNIETASRSNTGAGDMSMLYSFVKLLDPNSVVRESEFAAAAASGSFGERIQGAVQRLTTGERLPDTLRNSFLTEARNIFATQNRQYESTAETYRRLAERNGIDPENVVIPFGRAASPAAPPPAGAPAPQAVVPGPNGGAAEPPPAQQGATRPAQTAPAARAVLNGRIIVPRSGRWVYEDTGEAAQ
jgi:hypothetical protein